MDISSITKQIPDGVSYHQKTPNTLDLAERLSIAINALTRAWNKQGNEMINWLEESLEELYKD